jgi:hypothetical protein
MGTMQPDTPLARLAQVEALARDIAHLSAAWKPAASLAAAAGYFLQSPPRDTVPSLHSVSMVASRGGEGIVAVPRSGPASFS